MARLLILSEGFNGRSYDLKVDKTTVGRAEDNTIQIAEPSVSGHHCEISPKGADLLIKDLDSTNGTFINDEKISEAVLKAGQTLRLGQIELKIDAPAPAPAASTTAKKQLDPTASQRGVKMGDLDTTTKPVAFDKNSPFKEKSNKGNKVFIYVGVAVILVIIGLLVFAMKQLGAQPQ